MRLLLVEDSERLRADLSTALAAGGYAVDTAASVREARAFLDRYDYDLLVLDLMLPDGEGMEVLAHLRRTPQPTRVLVLSARDRVEDRVRALERGADDYLVKPFALSELEARLKALSRRRFDEASPLIEHGGLRVDTAARLVHGPNGAIVLSPKEYALLELLLRERGRVFTRGALFERLYAGHSAASDKVIEVLVSTLRGKLARGGVEDLIGTRRGYGYVVA
jgi:two-component system copper resistance phosphate regulon response regulator CusR